MSAEQDGSALEIHSRVWPALARTHLTARGSLTGAAPARLFEAVSAALRPGHHITLDLSEVTSADEHGAEAVRECQALAERERAELIIQDPSPSVRRALGIQG